MSKQNKEQNYSEADLVLMFHLERINTEYTPLMTEWTNAQTAFDDVSQLIFDKLWWRAKKNITAWQEEDLKMKLLSPLLELCNLIEGDNDFQTYFEKTIFATIDGHFLKTKTDFMIAKGVLDKPQTPYFHFQEWKPHKKPTGDSMAQLLEAMLIAQCLNGSKMPVYGVEIVGKQWTFVILEAKSYCISKSYDVTEKEDLSQIIAMLRKFKEILSERLLKFES